MAALLLIALAVFVYGLVSQRLEGSPVTAPMIFTAYGFVVGPEVLDWFDVGLDGGGAEILVEATLVLLLFTDAARIDLNVLRQERWLPSRLLGIGLPGTLVLGTVLALVLFPDLPFAYAALIAAVLAPTDAALGQAVVSDHRLPVRLRQGLNVESGLNDGIVLPVVAFFLAVAEADEDAADWTQWAEFAGRQIGFGLLAGIAAGVVGGRILSVATSRGMVDGLFQQLGSIAIAVMAFSAANLIDGNGFIAAFTAGLAFGKVTRAQWPMITDFTEDEGELLSLVTFALFGALLLPPAFDAVGWEAGVYAALSLTVVRMLPVAISLIGSGTLLETRLFVGWFGPRGLASILFALVVAEDLVSEAGEQIYAVACLTVVASIVLHGLSAAPWVGRLSSRLERAPHDAPEMMPVTDQPWRRGM